jgi:hypothetical protein
VQSQLTKVIEKEWSPIAKLKFKQNHFNCPITPIQISPGKAVQRPEPAPAL